MRFLVLFVLFFLKYSLVSLASDIVSRSQCFPIESLPFSAQFEANKILQLALDREALYSIASDIKPMSSDFTHLMVSAEESLVEKKRIEEFRQIAKRLQCTENIKTIVFYFKAVSDGKRHYSMAVFNLKAFKKLLAEEQEFFKPFINQLEVYENGVLNLEKLIQLIDESPYYIRFKGLGLLFGYPKHAIQFFVEAAESERLTGRRVERDFIAIPTFSGPSGFFTWAVPVGHQIISEELFIKKKAQIILKEYTKRRQYEQGSQFSAVELLRNWFCVEATSCKPHWAY